MKTIAYYLRIAVIASLQWLLLHLFWLFPIKKNKIVATAVRGKKYADNPRFIVEELIRRNRDLDIVWLQKRGLNYEVPNCVRIVKNNKNYIQLAYEYATAHVIIESAHYWVWLRRRKGQTFINTWHGGLGIKKIEYDANNLDYNKVYKAEISNTVNIANVFISNSSHLSSIYRRAFRYNGPIYNCGYPKNDMLFGNKNFYRKKVRKHFGLDSKISIVTYAPTFRDYFNKNGKWLIDMSVYNLDYERLANTFELRFGVKCAVLVKMHPNNMGHVDLSGMVNDHVIDVTSYNNVQELIMASDFFISDYSSCIFDAAMIGIPCFIYATDYEKYKSDERGVYYEMEELPFPYAKNNEEMEANVLSFHNDDYRRSWEAFAKRTGLNETGHAAKDIADKICDVLDGKTVDWNNSEI